MGRKLEADNPSDVLEIASHIYDEDPEWFYEQHFDDQSMSLAAARRILSRYDIREAEDDRTEPTDD